MKNWRAAVIFFSLIDKLPRNETKTFAKKTRIILCIIDWRQIGPRLGLGGPGQKLGSQARARLVTNKQKLGKLRLDRSQIIRSSVSFFRLGKMAKCRINARETNQQQNLKLAFGTIWSKAQLTSLAYGQVSDLLNGTNHSFARAFKKVIQQYSMLFKNL